MSDPISLQPHGLHSPDYTLKVAEAFSDAVRVLNYASGEYRDTALSYPNLIYSLLGNLVSGTGSMGQLIGQLAQQLEDLRRAGRLEVRTGPYAGNPTGAVATAVAELVQAVVIANQLGRALQHAQNAASSIGMLAHLFADEDETS